MSIPLASDQYLTAKQVRARYGGVSNTWLFRRMRDEGFPQPSSRFGGRQRYWLLSGLLAWEMSKIGVTCASAENDRHRPGVRLAEKD